MSKNTKPNDGGAAFPTPGREQHGMTLRQYAAGLAMQGMLAEDAGAYTWESLAVASVKAADALIAELEKGVGVSKDRPLSCDVFGDELHIKVGIGRLAWVALQRNGGPLRKGFKVINATAFAEDVAGAFERQDDDGNTLLNEVMDKAIQGAADDGSVGLQYPKRKKEVGE